MSSTAYRNNAIIVEKVSEATEFPLEMLCSVRYSRNKLVWVSWDLNSKAGIGRGMQGKGSMNKSEAWITLACGEGKDDKDGDKILRAGKKYFTLMI